MLELCHLPLCRYTFLQSRKAVERQAARKSWTGIFTVKALSAFGEEVKPIPSAIAKTIAEQPP